jgi:NADPH2:quinone reductase
MSQVNEPCEQREQGMHAIWIDKPGGFDVLTYRECGQPQPDVGEVLVKTRAIGVNFIDVYYRTGLYAASYPFIPGMEAVGVVEAVGAGVTECNVGDRVVYASSCPGSYAEWVVVPASIVVSVPEDIDDQSAAAGFLQGLTAHYLTHSTYPLQAGDTVLIQAAAGGMGSLLTQVARHQGARVIGTASTREKAQMAYAAGAHEVIVYTQANVEEEVRRLTKGEGVAVVYDNVGKTTFEQSLHCLRPCGYLVLYGQSSGLVPPFEPSKLASRSLFLTRPMLFDYIRDRESLLTRARAVLDWIATGKVQVSIWHTYALAEAAQAHRDLESRATMGKILLFPT